MRVTPANSLIDRFRRSARRAAPDAIAVIAVLTIGATAVTPSQARAQGSTHAVQAPARPFTSNARVAEYGPYSSEPAVSLTMDLERNILAFGDANGMVTRPPKSLAAAMRLPVAISGGLASRYAGLSGADLEQARHEATRVMGSTRGAEWDQALTNHVRSVLNTPDGFPAPDESATRLPATQVIASRPAPQSTESAHPTTRSSSPTTAEKVSTRATQSADDLGNNIWYNIEWRVRDRVNATVGKATDRVLGRP
jgi:hypothetical protein